MNIAPLIRILLRIVGGMMIERGYASEADMWIFTDEALIGMVAIALSEGWYFLSKRYGWAT